MDLAVQNFGRQVQGADVALFYYAGHGVQVSGANYLVPVSANPTREADVDFQMVDVNLVLRQMQGSGTRLNMVILDACRNNPFGARGLRASDGGLAQMRAPEGTLISYATQPGNVALDGADGHSPYTKALAATDQAGRARHLPDLQPGRPRREAPDRRLATALGVLLADRRQFLFRGPCPGRVIAAARGHAAARAPLASTLRPDPDRIPIKDPVLLRELSDRLFELNYDPEPLDSKNGMRLAISKFQEKAKMTPNGEATEGVLTRLRKMEDLKPWGSIVYGPDGDKWGMSWNHVSRRAAIDDARRNCGANKCPMELSFYGIAMRRVCDLGQILVAGSARHRCSGPRRRRLTSAARLANLVALLARYVPTGPAAKFFIRDIGSTAYARCRSTFDPRSPARLLIVRLRSAPALRWRNPAAPAAASAMTRNRCPVRANRRARPIARATPQQGPRRKNRAARPKERWRRRQFRWRVDRQFRRRHLLGHQQQRGRRHQRQDYRPDRQRHRQSRRQVYGTSSGNGITVITTGRLSGRSGGGTFRQSDGCTGRWTAAKQ